MKRDKGFTLIEIIVSIALVGIILVGILPVMAQGLIFLNKTKEITQDVFSAQQMMELAIESAKDHTSGLTPKKAILFPGHNIEVSYYEVVNIYENKKYVTMVSEARPAEYEALTLTGVKAIANNDETLKAVPSGSGNRIDGKHDVVTHPDFFRNIYQWYVSKPGYNIPYPSSSTTIPEAEVGTLYPVFPFDYQALPLGYDVKYLSDLSKYTGRHVVFTATPASVKGKLGQLVFSTPILVVGYPDMSKLLVHLDASLIDLSNNNEVDTGINILLKSWINQKGKSEKFQGSNNERPKVMTNKPNEGFSGRYVDFDAGNVLAVNGFSALQDKNIFVFAVVKGEASTIIKHNGDRLNTTNPAPDTTDDNIIQIGGNWKIVKTNYTSYDEKFKKISIGSKDIDIAEVLMFDNLTEDEVNKVIQYLKDKYKIRVETKDIVSLHDIEHEVFKGESYTLPSSVLATFKDGSTRYVAVTWPDLTYAPGGIVDTSTVRTFIFTGHSVDSPANKVSLRVKIKPTLKFTSLKINPITQPLVPGGTVKLTYTFTPALGTVESIKWQSSAPSIATIGANTGDVVGIKKGKTTITLIINGINVATYELNVGSSKLPVSDGLVLHLSASDAENFEIASEKVKTWIDLSGNNNDFAQSSSDKQPKWVNGLVQFAGDDYLVKAGDLSGVELFTKKGTNFTTFIVAQASNQSNNWGGYISNYMDDRTSYLFGRSYGNYFEHVVNDSSDHLEWISNDGINLFSTINNSGNLTSWINGANKISKDYGNGSSNGERFIIGAGRGGAGNYLNGSIGEIIVYNKVLTDVEINTMNQYLSNKYFTYEWTFSNSGDFIGSSPIFADVNNVKIENGVLSGSIIGLDPRISSRDSLNLQLGNSKKIKISLKNQSESTKAQIYFDTVASHGLGEDKVVTFDIQKNSDFTEYTVDFSANTKWTGVLKSLRIDPATSVTSGNFEIDYIKITE